MTNDHENDLFADQRDARGPRDPCRCGHSGSNHRSVLQGFTGKADPYAGCMYPGCECSGFADPLPAAEELANALNKPEVPGFVGTSSTSRASAIAQYFKRPSVKRRLFHFIEQQGERGATCDEVECALAPIRHETASSTICSLKQRGALVAGERKRPTRRGFLAEVLVVPIELRGIVEVDADDFKIDAAPRRRPHDDADPPYCDGRR